MLILAASLAIGACGATTAAPYLAVGITSSGSDQSARLRALNEALYPETPAATPSRLQRLNEALYPSQSESAEPQSNCRRPC
jgi:hypothetical protein